MNDRIKELAKQARKYARDYVADCMHYGHYMEHNEIEVKFEEKFAELCVLEMCQVMKAEGDEFSLDQNFHAVRGVGRCMRRVKQHFGVEE